MADESTIRSGRKIGFTTLTNTVLRDKRLTLKTKGMFAVMMSLPQDWSYSISGLCSITGVGRATVRACLAELQNFGYLHREQTHTGNGKFGGSIYVLNDEPENTPLSENRTTVKRNTENHVPPSSGKPTSEKPMSENRPLQSKDQQKKERQTPIAPAEVLNILAPYVGEDPELRAAMTGFLEMRRKKRNALVTTRATTLLLNRLDKLSGGRRKLKISLLDNATERGWTTVYALKADELPAPEHNSGRGGRFL